MQSQGIVHLLERNRDGSYSVTCGTILDSIDAGVRNFRFVSCGWCLKQVSASETIKRLPVIPASAEMDAFMEAIDAAT